MQKVHVLLVLHAVACTHTCRHARTHTITRNRNVFFCAVNMVTQKINLPEKGLVMKEKYIICCLIAQNSQVTDDDDNNNNNKEDF